MRELFPSAKGGREGFARWDNARIVPPFEMDPQDALFRNSYGPLHIKDGIASFAPEQSRLYVLTPKDGQGHYTAPLWRNVEMTVYVKRGATSTDAETIRPST